MTNISYIYKYFVSAERVMAYADNRIVYYILYAMYKLCRFKVVIITKIVVI